MTKLRLYGDLAEFAGAEQYEISAESAAEAVRFLAVNFPGLERHMRDQWYEVKVGGVVLAENEIHYPISSTDQVTITPIITGGGAVGRIILGAALIAVSFAIPGSWVVLGASVQTFAFGVGAALVLGGVSQLLTPNPSIDSRTKDPKTVESYSFSGLQNVNRQGVPVPIVYGEVVTGSVVISAGIDSYIK